MKPYYELKCTNLDQIQEQVLKWLENKSNILESDRLWNKIDTIDLIRSAPAVMDFFKTLNLKPRELSLTVINERKPINLHIDELPVTAKINIPILNTKRTMNRWYEIPKEILSTTVPTINSFGKKYYEFDGIDLSKLELVGEVELVSPVVFNSQIAHNIIIPDDAKLPRIVLACTFIKQPIDYLMS